MPLSSNALQSLSHIQSKYHHLLSLPYLITVSVQVQVVMGCTIVELHEATSKSDGVL